MLRFIEFDSVFGEVVGDVVPQTGVCAISIGLLESCERLFFLAGIQRARGPRLTCSSAFSGARTVALSSSGTASANSCCSRKISPSAACATGSRGLISICFLNAAIASGYFSCCCR